MTPPWIDLAEEGCNIIFSDSYGHQSYMLDAAEDYPDVTFVSCTGDMAATSGLDNYKNLFPYTYESRYVSGVVAGMKLKELMDAGTVTDPKVGYVGAYPYAEVVCGYTAFLLGIQTQVPEAYMEVQYTNSWYDPVAEGEAANALMARGCVIIGQHADSTGAPSAVQAQKDAGSVVYSVGYNIDMLEVAPTAALTSSQNNWSVLYRDTLEKFIAGEEVPVDYAVGISEDAVMIIDLAYAMTVHKAQGSEYQCVVLAAMPAAPSLMVRGVLYTALTRARELLIVVGDDAAIRAMAANDRQQRRYSGLRWRLAHFADPAER